MDSFMRYGLLSRYSKACAPLLGRVLVPRRYTLNDLQTKCVIDTVTEQRNCKPITDQRFQAM